MHYYLCKQDFSDAIGLKKQLCDENCLKCIDYVYLTEEELNGVRKVLLLLEKNISDS